MPADILTFPGGAPLPQAPKPEGAREGPLTDEELEQLVDPAADPVRRWAAYRAVVELLALRRQLDSARAVMMEAMEALESEDEDQQSEAFEHLQDEFEGVTDEAHARAVAVFEERLGRKPTD